MKTIIIKVRDGQVQHIISEEPVFIRVLDEDIGACDPSEVETIDEEQCKVLVFDPQVDKSIVERIETQIKEIGN